MPLADSQDVRHIPWLTRKPREFECKRVLKVVRGWLEERRHGLVLEVYLQTGARARSKCLARPQQRHGVGHLDRLAAVVGAPAHQWGQRLKGHPVDAKRLMSLDWIA